MAKVDPQYDQFVELLEMEGGAYMYVDGVTTITFFNGDTPLDQVKDRLVKVVQASPWLCGKLVKAKGRGGKKVEKVFAF